MDGTVLYVNRMFLDVLRLTEEAYRSSRPFSLFVDTVEGERLRRELDRAGRIRRWPVKLSRADGSTIRTRISATRLRCSGQDAFLYWLADIVEFGSGTLPGLAQTAFEAVFDHAPVSLTIKNREGRYIHINRNFADWVGRDIEEVVGGTAGDIFGEETAREIARADAMVVESGHALSREFDVRRLDGAFHRLHEVKFPIRDLDGRIDAIGVAMFDRTDQYQLEEKLRQSQKMETVGQLTGGIAHDFNNLLGIMLAAVEMLEDRIGADAAARQQLAAIGKAVDRGASLTQRLLAFARRQTLSPSTTNVNDLILGLEEMFRRTLGATVDLRVLLAVGVWQATVDRNQCENALINLAVNARDAMPGGGTLTIETANVDLDANATKQMEGVAPGSYVMITVSDTGAGMAPDVLARAYEPFFTTKDAGKGTGLGLSMVYGFVKQSDGHVAILSDVGQGTSVKVYLPKSDEASSTGHAEAARPEAVGGAERILVVEDDDDLRRIPVETLRRSGYVVAEARNGAEATTLLNGDRTFDLLFTDVVLAGGVSGIEVARIAAAAQPGVRVLFTTGYALNAAAKGTEFGQGTAVLGKPYRRADLLEKVRAALDAEVRDVLT